MDPLERIKSINRKAATAHALNAAVWACVAVGFAAAQPISPTPGAGGGASVMEQVLAYLQTALNWVNDPMHKTVLAMVGNFVLNRWPAFINKAIPAVSMAVSIGLGAAQLISAALGATFGGVQGASFVAAVAAEAGKPSTVGLILDVVAGTFIPVIVSVGTHSWWKNFLQWLALGRPLLRK